MTVMNQVEGAGLDLDLTYVVAQSQDVNDLRAAAERFCETHDFAYWLYALAGPDKALTNYSDVLISAYTENRWLCCGCDPLVDAMHRRHGALSWDLRCMPNLARPTDVLQRRLMECRWDAGMRAGVSAPAYGRRGNAFEYAIVSFSRDRPLSEVAKRYLEPHVQLFAAYFLNVAQHIFMKPRPKAAPTDVALTPRERDCLSWVAIGKSSWEIGQVLGITTATVNFHLGNAAIKLGVRGRTCAVAQAIRLGLINPA